jgi:prolyl-tRNA editing enzyme YbaK/EbsC (Cys-tRNA(Pro) deacylase)
MTEAEWLTCADPTARATIFVSAGRRGLQVELAPRGLIRLTGRPRRRWRVETGDHHD